MSQALAGRALWDIIVKKEHHTPWDVNLGLGMMKQANQNAKLAVLASTVMLILPPALLSVPRGTTALMGPTTDTNIHALRVHSTTTHR